MMKRRSYRQEANALTVLTFRNGFIEDLHAGRSTPILDDPTVSRITDPEMKKLNIEISARLAQLLELRDNDPETYERKIAFGMRYTNGWEEHATTFDVPKPESVSCPACKQPILKSWAYCADCGTPSTASSSKH